MFELHESLCDWSCVEERMCSVTTYTILIPLSTTWVNKVSKKDYLRCPRRLREACFCTKEVREGSETPEGYKPYSSLLLFNGNLLA